MSPQFDSCNSCHYSDLLQQIELIFSFVFLHSKVLMTVYIVLSAIGCFYLLLMTWLQFNAWRLQQLVFYQWCIKIYCCIENENLAWDMAVESVEICQLWLGYAFISLKELLKCNICKKFCLLLSGIRTYNLTWKWPVIIYGGGGIEEKCFSW